MEAIYLVCGARRSQLMRDTLGRTRRVVLSLLARNTRGSMTALVLLVLVCTAAVAAQNRAGSPLADSTVRALVRQLSTHDTAGLRLPFDSGMLAATGISHDSLLHMLAAGLDIGDIRTITVIDGTYFHPFGATRVDERLTYHIVGERESRLVFVAASTDSGRTRLTGMRWNSAPNDLRRMNPFTLAGKSWLHYAFLIIAVCIPLLSIATAIIAVRSGVRFRWLWALGSLIGIGKLGLVWSDASLSVDAFRFAPIYLQLLGASVFKYPLYAPWVVSISLPAAAILFWAIAWPRRGASAPQPVEHGAA